MQPNGRNTENPLQQLAEIQHQTEKRIAAVENLILWSLGIILWWIIRVDGDIGPIKPSDLPQLSPFLLRCLNDLIPFVIALITVIVVRNMTRYRPPA